MLILYFPQQLVRMRESFLEDLTLEDITILKGIDCNQGPRCKPREQSKLDSLKGGTE